MPRINRIPFNKKNLEALPLPPPGEKARYFDERTPGLGIRVYGPGKTNESSPGRKSFIFLRRVGQQLGQIKLGDFPAMTVEQARGKASEYNAAIAAGQNPFEGAKAKREELTLRGLFELFIKEHVTPYRKDSTVKGYEFLFDRHVKGLAGKKLSGIRQEHIRSLHRKVGEVAPVSSNRVLVMLSTLFGWAIKTRTWTGENPAKGLSKFREKPRDRYLEGDEVPRFFQALEQEENPAVRDYFLIALLTGARKSNVLAMRWDQLSLDREEWRIPETKNGSALTVNLPTQAVEILRARLEKRELVFPELETFHPASWRRIRRTMGLKGIKVDDQLLQSMRWDSLDLKLGVWSAPTGRKILPPAAAEALRERAKARDFVFPGPGEAGHLADPKKGWTRLLERSGLQNLRIHDLRHSLASWQVNSGATLVIIGKSLGHKSLQSTARYAHLNQDPVRHSVQTAVDAIFEHAKEKSTGEVVELKGKRGAAGADRG